VKQPRPVFAATAIAIATAVAGGTGGAEPAGGDAGDSVRGVSDAIVRVGGLGDAGLFPGAGVGARARFERANRDGELPGGRTIEYVRFADDRSDRATDLAEGRALVEQDGVFAVAPVVTSTFEAASFLGEEDVPALGWGLAPEFCGNEHVFGFSGCLLRTDVITNVWALLIERALEPANGKTAAVVSDDDRAGLLTQRTVTAAADDVGFDVVYADEVPRAGAPDYTPFATAILDGDDGEPPDVVFLTGAFGNVTGLVAKLRELGYQGAITTNAGYDPRLVAQFAGASIFVEAAPFESAPATVSMQRLIDDVRAVDPAVSLTQAVAAGYLSADMLVKMLRATGRRLTPERFLDAANNGFVWRLKGTAGPTVFPKGHDEPTPCGALVQSNGFVYEPLVPYRCGKVIEA
jgi:branched-chain amino acid transport system substrate-binding protein